MTEDEAIGLVQREVLSSLPDCSILPGSNEDRTSFFVLYYQSNKFISTGKESDMYLGHGPVIVCKKTSNVFPTGSAKTIEEYCEAFEACGDPNAELTNVLEVYGWREGANKVVATKLFRLYSSLGLKGSKLITDNALKGVATSFEVSEEARTSEALQSIDNVGFKIRRLWSNQTK